MRRSYLRDISVYQTSNKIYATGYSNEDECWKLIKVDRGCQSELAVSEDAARFTRNELEATLRTLHHGNVGSGGLITIAQSCPALIGCFRWTACYYLLVVTKARIVGKISGAAIYGIDATALLPLAPSHSTTHIGGTMAAPAVEARCRRLLSLVDLTRDFFFSYDWPLWATVQKTLTGPTQAHDGFSPFHSDRVWNEHLTSALRHALGHDLWTMPLIHGSWKQRCLSLLGRPLTLTLVARRSKRFAGTRYQRRGVNDEGHVANDVEIEQIVEVDSCAPLSACISSVVQVRGSVPLYWSQSSFDPGDAALLRPSIRMLHFLDPLYVATSKHFTDLRHRFGDPIICLDLLRQSDRRKQESVLSDAYAEAISFLNRRNLPEHLVQYVQWDMRHRSRYLGSNLLSDLQQTQAPLLADTGVFAAAPASILKIQQGVLRTSCVDCLDRTNVGQFAFGLLALGEQLRALGIMAEPEIVNSKSTLAGELMLSYERIGNSLAEQYAGSEAHTGIFQRFRGDWHAAHQSRDFLTTIRRFYSNVVTDEDKQQAINLFLGAFVPPARQSTAGEGRNLGNALSRPESANSVHTAGEALIHNDAVEVEDEAGDALLGCCSSPVKDDSPLLSPVNQGPSQTANNPRIKSPFESRSTGKKSVTGVVGCKPRWVLKPTQPRQSMHLQSLNEVLPADVRAVRLTAPPTLRSAAQQSSWLLSPRRSQRPGTASTEASSVGHYSVLDSPPPPPRLVRSNSADVLATLPSTSAAVGVNKDVLRGGGGGRGVRGDPVGRVVAEGMPALANTSTLPSGTSAYHALAGLNLEGADLPPAPSVSHTVAAVNAGPKESASLAMLPFAGLVQLKQLVLGGGRGSGTSSSHSGSVPISRAPSPVASSVEDQAEALGATTKQDVPKECVNSLMTPPVLLETMLQQHEAVARGMDDLGLSKTTHALWMRPEDAMRALDDEARGAAAAAEHDAQAAFVPLTPAEFADLERAVATQMLPAVATTPGVVM